MTMPAPTQKILGFLAVLLVSLPMSSLTPNSAATTKTIQIVDPPRRPAMKIATLLTSIRPLAVPTHHPAVRKEFET
jgi:hypothetical protein